MIEFCSGVVDHLLSSNKVSNKKIAPDFKIQRRDAR